MCVRCVSITRVSTRHADKRQQEYLGELVDGESFTFAHNLVRSIIDTLGNGSFDVSGFTVNGQGVEDADLADQPGTGGATGGARGHGGRRTRRTVRKLRSIVVRCGMARHTSSWTGIAWPCARSSCCTGLTPATNSQASSCTTIRRTATGFCTQPVTFTRSTRSTQAQRDGSERPSTSLAKSGKYIMGKTAGQWEPHMDAGDATWPLPWIDGKGAPLGIPVVEFANPGGSEIDQIIGLQNALNKTWLDLIAAADASGFPSRPSNIRRGRVWQHPR